MASPRRATGRLPLAGLLSILAAGCGGGSGVHGVPVYGRVVERGQPIELKGDLLIVEFVGADGNRAFRATGVCDPSDGSFSILGPSQSGIPLGKYRVVLFPGKATDPGGKDTLFADAFGEESPLELNLTAENSDRVIVDVGTKTVTAE